MMVKVYNTEFKFGHPLYYNKKTSSHGILVKPYLKKHLKVLINTSIAIAQNIDGEKHEYRYSCEKC